jgi:hypothetical protein
MFIESLFYLEACEMQTAFRSHFVNIVAWARFYKHSAPNGATNCLSVARFDPASAAQKFPGNQ